MSQWVNYMIFGAWQKNNNAIIGDHGLGYASCHPTQDCIIILLIYEAKVACINNSIGVFSAEALAEGY